MKDCLGNEIHIGDTILFSGRNSRGYQDSFDECVVIYRWSDWRMSDNVINLTALGVRPRQEVKDNE